MSFHISKDLDFKPDDNCVSPLGQTIRGQAGINFIVKATWPLTWSSSLTPGPRGKILYFSLKTLFLIRIFVSQVSVWILMSKGNVQFNYLFPKTDGALKLEASRLELSLPLGSQHNKFCCFFSTAAQIITTFTQHTHCFHLAIFTLVPAQVGMHCQFPTCRYITVRKEQLRPLWTDFHDIWYFSIFLKVCWENSGFIKIRQA